MSSYVYKHGEVISRDLLDLISKRYHTITKAVNKEFWGIQDDTMHSLYVGSYGRGTATDASDIDMLVELPRDEYSRFDTQKGNGQSRLLQAVKNAILTSYPKSDVHGDGQVVVIKFADGVVFEVLPAFKDYYKGTFVYPDTHMGGRWKATDPKAEQNAMREKNNASNGLLFDTCKHIRRVRDENFSSYKLSGIVIDSFVYWAMGNWQWCSQGPSNSQWGDYERVLLDSCIKMADQSQNILFAPGSMQNVDLQESMVGLLKVLTYMCRN